MDAPSQFIKRCLECVADGGNPTEIAKLTREALVAQRANAGAWGKAEVLHCSADLLVVDLTLPPFATSAIHEHNTWAVIGVSEGCEVDEILEERAGRLAWTVRHELRPDGILVLSADCIHFIGNPLPTVTRGIHVYGRNLAMTQRRMWHSETGTPQAMDLKLFEAWEKILSSRSAANSCVVAPAI